MGKLDVVVVRLKVIRKQRNKKPALTSEDEVARAVLRVVANAEDATFRNQVSYFLEWFKSTGFNFPQHGNLWIIDLEG